MENILEVENLVKTFKGSRVVDGVSFNVPKGKVIGLLGPNGAGKTTTIHMLIGITEPSGGAIRYFGKDFFKNRLECLSKINFSSAYNTLQGRITVRENLLVFAGIYNVKNAREKIKKYSEYFEISELMDHRFWDLSAGQKTRVNLCKSLLNDPELILLDEPTASLDPDIADKMLSLIEDLKKEREISILYTSHNMDEITRICDEVIFLDHGKIIAKDTPVELTKKIPGAELRVIFEGDRKFADNFLLSTGAKYEFTHEYAIFIKTEEKMVPKIIFGLSNAGIYLTDIEIKKPTLEDVFIELARGGELSQVLRGGES